MPPALRSVLVALRAASPLVMTTRAMTAESNTAPMNEKPWAPLWAGASRFAIRTPAASKYSMRVEPARSTSEKTTPKPLVRPLVVVPASWKSTSTWFEPTAMNSFFGENALNWSPRPALTEAKAVLSTRRPVPGVDITTPRFELTLKKVAGKLSTLVTAAGAPGKQRNSRVSWRTTRECPRSTGGLGVGRCYSRTLSGGRLRVGLDGSIAATRALGAPVRPHARERHGDLSPSCRHPGGGRRGRGGRSRVAPALAGDARLVAGAGPPCQRARLGASRPRSHFRERPADDVRQARQLCD